MKGPHIRAFELNSSAQGLLAFTEGDRWQPGIGDPSLMGWFTVFAYFVAAGFCGWVARRVISQRVQDRVRQGGFWALLAMFLAILGINKQLDLQTWFTLFAKDLALRQGWYEQRAIVQVFFIVAIAFAGVAALLVVVWLTRSMLRQNALALAGCVFLGCFVLIRASSFHHVDLLLGSRLAGLKVNWLLELGGITLVALAATRNLKRLRHCDGSSSPSVSVHPPARRMGSQTKPLITHSSAVFAPPPQDHQTHR